MPAGLGPAEPLVARDVAEVEALLGDAPDRALAEHVALADLGERRHPGRRGPRTRAGRLRQWSLVHRTPVRTECRTQPLQLSSRANDSMPALHLQRILAAANHIFWSTIYGSAPMQTSAAVLWAVGTPWSVEEIELDPPRLRRGRLIELRAAGMCHTDDHYRTGDMVSPSCPSSAGTRAPASSSAARAGRAHGWR